MALGTLDYGRRQFEFIELFSRTPSDSIIIHPQSLHYLQSENLGPIEHYYRLQNSTVFVTFSTYYRISIVCYKAYFEVSRDYHPPYYWDGSENFHCLVSQTPLRFLIPHSQNKNY